ncbi:S-adenosyl-L-methionine-dependent methyltransferase, partial [Clavulina sp. PMI_390]
LRLGYNLSLRTLRADQFGVAQTNSRVVLIGAKDGLTVPFELKATHTPSELVADGLAPVPSVRDAIGDLAVDNPRADNATANPKFLKTVANASSYVQRINYPMASEKPEYITHHSTGKDATKMWSSDGFSAPQWDSPSRTIRNSPSALWDCLHPDEERLLTVRELARIQSFPDNWVFCGGIQEQYRQVGNAVPPLLAYAVAQMIRDAALEDYPDLRF